MPIDMLTGPKVTAALSRIAKKRDLCLIVLYGSVSRGTETAMSDIDIGVLGSAPLSHEDEAVIGEDIAKASGFSRVEVRSLHRVSPLFLTNVMNEGVVLFEDTPSRAQEVRLYAWKMAAETRHMREAHYKQVQDRIEAHV